MAPSAISDPDARPLPGTRRRRRRAAFSLVEVALCLGIVAFALVPVFGLLPIGLSSFRKGMDLSVGAQITQRIIDEAQQSDFEKLVANHDGPFTEPVRYFTAQGEEQTGADAAKSSNIIYRVNTRIAPSTVMPGDAAPDGGPVNRNLATVTVQVANNPGNHAVDTDAGGLWIATKALPLATASTYVARNSATP